MSGDEYNPSKLIENETFNSRLNSNFVGRITYQKFDKLADGKS